VALLGLGEPLVEARVGAQLGGAGLGDRRLGGHVGVAGCHPGWRRESEVGALCGLDGFRDRRAVGVPISMRAYG
jgi:hypothetical protein